MHNNKLKKLINRVIAVASLSAMVLAGTAVTVNATPVWPSNVDTESNAAIVMEAETGAILYEKNIDVQHYPASITKILTTLLAIEN